MNFGKRIFVWVKWSIVLQVIYDGISRYMQYRCGIMFAIPTEIHPFGSEVGVKTWVVYYIIPDFVEVLGIKNCLDVISYIRYPLYLFNIIAFISFFIIRFGLIGLLEFLSKFFKFFKFFNRFVGACGKHYAGGEGGYNKGEAFHMAIGLRG